MRDAVYMSEFRQFEHRRENHRVHDVFGAGYPYPRNAATNGDALPPCPSLPISFHGRMVTRRKAEPTKNTAIRTITELAAFGDRMLGVLGLAARDGGDLGAGTIEKITVTTPTVTALTLLGKESANVCGQIEKSDLCPPQTDPRSSRSPGKQRSGDLDSREPEFEPPNGTQENRFVAVMAVSNRSAGIHIGIPSYQNSMILAPAIARSRPQSPRKYQYSQPTENPAHSPRDCRA